MIAWIKEHKILAAVLGVVVFYLFYRLFSGGGSSSVQISGPSDAMSQAELAYQAQQTQTQAQSTLATQQLQAGLINAQISAAVANQQNQAAVQANANQLVSAGNINESNNQTALALANIQTGAQIQLNGTNTAAALEALKTQTSSNQEMNAAQIAGAESIQQMMNDAAAAQNGTAVDIANISAGVANNQNATQLQEFNAANASNERLGTLSINDQNSQATQQNRILQSEVNNQKNFQQGYLALERNAQTGQFELANRGLDIGTSGFFGPNNSASIVSASLGYPGLGQSQIQGNPAGSFNWNAFVNTMFGPGGALNPSSYTSYVP